MEREETVPHFLSEFSMNLEHERNENPRIIRVIILKKTEKPSKTCVCSFSLQCCTWPSLVCVQFLQGVTLE